MRLTVRATIVAAMVAALGACGNKGAHDAIEVAQAALARNDSATAVVELKALLEREPQSAPGRFLLGKALLAQGNAKAAEIELGKAEELKHDPSQVAPERARALVAMGEPAQALQRYRALQLTDIKAEAELKVTLAAAAAATGKPELAESLLAEAAKVGPELPRAALLRARLELAAGQVEAAISRLQAARTGGGPEAADAWVLTGEIQQSRRKNTEAALSAFRQALEADPSHVAAHRGIVLLLLAGGDTKGAAAQLDALERAKPNQPAAKVLHAMLALAQGNHLGVREKVQPLLNASPGNPTLLELAGVAELHLNALDKAETLLKTAIERAPHLILARQALAQVYLQRGQPEPALETLAPLLNAGQVSAAVTALASQAHLLAGNVGQAQKLLAAGHAAHPGDERIVLSQLIARLGQGDDAAALSELEALAKRSRSITPDSALIAHAFRKKDWARAMTAIDGLARKQPDAPNAHLLRAQVLAARSDLVGARASFDEALKIDSRLLPALQGLARLDIAQGRPADARSRLSALVADRPADVRAQLVLVEIMDHIGTPPEEVVAQLRKAVAASPSAVSLRLRLVNTLLKYGDSNAARSAAAEAVAAVAGNAELLHAQGRAALAAGDHELAARLFTELAQRLPKSPQLQLDLASARLAQGEPAGAERHLRQALSLAPDLRLAQETLLSVLLQRGRIDEAMAHAREVKTRSPASATGYLLEARVEAARRHGDAAIAAYRRALHLEPSGHAALQLHAALMADGRTEEAARHARAWAAAHPEQLDFAVYLADQTAMRGDLALAESAYRELLSRAPAHTGALNNLAWLLARQNKPGAVALAERARAAAPYSAAVQDTLALALESEGQIGRATKLQTQLVERVPDNPDFRLHLAHLLVKSGDKAKARRELDRLAKLGERYPRQREVAQLQSQL